MPSPAWQLARELQSVPVWRHYRLVPVLQFVHVEGFLYP